MQICLATAHSCTDFVPLALLYLKATLMAEGTARAAQVDIVEFDKTEAAAEVAGRVLAGAPALIGFSCYVWNIKTLLAASAIIKERRPDVRIVLGGPEVGPVARAVLERNPAVDCIVKGEGERVFNELVKAWQGGGDLAAVKGICFRDDGGVHDTGEAPILQDLNRLASPFGAIDFDPRGRIICLETQRGCVFRCSFCFYNKDLSIRNRRFDLDRVKQELSFWLRQDIAELFLMDPVFNLNPARAKEICRFIAANNSRGIRIRTEVWAEFIDQEMAGLMKDAQFQFLEVGLQTTDEEVLATVERPLKLARFLDGLGHLKAAGIPFQLQLILGLPGETPASFRASLAFAVSLQVPDLAVFPLMILPGTELWRNAATLGLIYDPEPPYYLRSHPALSAADIDHGLKLAKAVNRLRDSRTFQLLGREPGLTFVEVVDAWVAWVKPEPGSKERDCAMENVRAFLLSFCAKRQIPAEFYLGFATLEFSPPPAPEASGQEK